MSLSPPCSPSPLSHPLLLPPAINPPPAEAPTPSEPAAGHRATPPAPAPAIRCCWPCPFALLVSVDKPVLALHTWADLAAGSGIRSRLRPGTGIGDPPAGRQTRKEQQPRRERVPRSCVAESKPTASGGPARPDKAGLGSLGPQFDAKISDQSFACGLPVDATGERATLGPRALAGGGCRA